jgi:predicted ester cyclase
MSTDIKATARTIEKGLLDAGALEKIPDIFVPEARVRGPIYTIFMAPLEGLDDIREHVVGNRTGFPDLNHAIHAQIADGDGVVTYFTVSGTNTGPFVGQPPTGKHMGGPGISVEVMGPEGKIVQSWQTCDRTLNFTQLGALPPGLLPDTHIAPEDFAPPPDLGAPSDTASPEENKAVVTSLYQAYNAGDRAALAELLAPDFLGRMPGMVGTDAQSYLDYVEDVHRNLELKAEVQLLVAEGDWVAALVRLTGFHRGEYLGRPGTNRPIAIETVDTWKVSGGKVVELFGLPDNFALGLQVGAIRIG